MGSCRHSGLVVLLFAVSALGFSASAFATENCVAASEDVVSAVMLREGASTSTSITGRLAPEERARLVGEVPYWYRVVLASGAEAFASKRWTEVVECLDLGIASTAQFELHAIDVGTGLSIFVRGDDFSLLYDAGSNDDLALREKNRVLAYLRALAPEPPHIDHIVLSHPHRDHVELLGDVFANYEVRDVWNSGAYSDICGYRALIKAIATEPNVRYHTALDNYGVETIELPERCRASAETIELQHGARIDADPIALGADASMRFLYVDGSLHSDLNDNSLVVQLNLGEHTVLLMGDAGGGSRQSPTAAASPKSIEGVLLACCAGELASDVLIVGHHGSKTSSRAVFLDAVRAKIYVVSSGPHKYSGTTLPDADIIEELERRGAVWRTDVDDAACALSEHKVGELADNRPGGCNNILIRFSPQGMQAAYEPLP